MPVGFKGSGHTPSGDPPLGRPSRGRAGVVSWSMAALLTRSNIPNLLTCLRLVLAAGFFALLSGYQFPEGPEWLLRAAAGLFVVAAATDALDGYLARKWNAVSAFGRIMDPFADKVLVLGAFVMLAGPGFTLVEGWGGIGVPGRSPELLSTQISGVAPWMAIVILARELLVTTIRAVLESRGIDFSASGSGKAKMVVQSVGVPAILLLCSGIEATSMHFMTTVLIDELRPGQYPQAQLARVIAWLVTIVTAWSAVPYVTRAATALRPSPPEASE